MPTTRYRRQFSAGSRPAPDPYDKFLDLEGFYRKHTARDASCLFRAISEQMYDNQDYHERIRKDCVNYLIKHRDQYEHATPTKFDEYITHMGKSTSYGTFLELKAIGYMYKRNILLYQPYDLGMWLVKEPEYTDSFRIFFAPEKHFDSVYTKPFIVKAAFCQSILYEMLYKNVFKLPDVEFSVETMLHGVGDGYTTEMYGTDSYTSHILLDDGRKFQLDKPENTFCILDNAQLCHFHNPDFEVIAEQVDRCTNPNDALNMQRMLNASLPDKYLSCVRQLLNQGITPFPYKVAKALDPDIYRNIEFDSWSDMRKEASAKTWYNGGWDFQVGAKCWVKLYDSQDQLFKCHIQEMSPNKGPCVVFVEELAEKRSVAISSLQPMNDSKWALPHRFKRNRGNAASNAYEFSRKIGMRHHPFHDKKPTAFKKHQKFADIDNELFDCTNAFDSRCRNVDRFCDLDAYTTDLSHFQPLQLDLVTMPLHTYYRSNNHHHNNSGDRGDRGGSNANSNHNQNQKSHRHSPTQQQKNARNAQQAPKQSEPQVQLLKRDADEEKEFQVMTPTPTSQQPQQMQQLHGPEHPVDVSVPPPPPPPPQAALPMHYGNNGGFVQYYYPSAECVDASYYNVPGEMMASQPVYQVPAQAYAAAPIPMQAATAYTVTPSVPANQLYTVPMAGWSNSGNPTTYYMPASSAAVPVAVPALPPLPIRHRELLRIHSRINLNTPPSLSPNGADLPMNDKSTIRFFYNMGIEFFHNLQATYGLSQLMSILENENGSADSSSVDYESSAQLSTDFQQMSFDASEQEMPPQTPHKERMPRYHYEGYFPGPTVNQNRRPNPNTGNYRKDVGKPNNKPNQRYNSYAPNASKQSMNKSGPKHYQNGGHSYDSTPVKDPNGKPHYESANNSNNNHAASGNNLAKRDTVYVTPDASNTMPPPPTHSPYLSPYMSYVQYDGNAEQHPPMYMPMSMFPSPGFAQMPLPQQPAHGPMPVASPCEQDGAEPFHHSPAPGYNPPAYGFAPNYWGQPPAPTHLVPQPQSSLNSSSISNTSSNTNSGGASNPSQ